MLEVSHIDLKYGQSQILFDVSLKAKTGKITTVMGNNGVGKTSLAKKLAAGATHLLIDIPMGPTAKVRSQADALRLRKLFEFVGDRVGLQLEVMITDGHQPIGRGIGPVLEGKLKEPGITDIRQVAAFTQADIDRISEHLNFKGRIERDEWVKQAQALIKP